MHIEIMCLEISATVSNHNAKEEREETGQALYVTSSHVEMQES